MLKPKLAAEAKSDRTNKAVQAAMAKKASKNISVKTVRMDERERNHRLSLDNSKGEKVLSSYPFIKKASKVNIMAMDEIAAFENTENPKEAIRRLVADAKQRREAYGIDDHQASGMGKKSAVKTKTQKTLKIGKEEVEINVKVVKSSAKRSASSKKAVSSAKSVKSRKVSMAKSVSATRKANLVKSIAGKKAATAKASVKQEKSASKSIASAKSKAKSVKE